METYVVGKIDRDKAEKGSIDGVIERLTPAGYNFHPAAGSYDFTKTGRVESVITEMVTVCEDHGLDVEDFSLIEYRKSDGLERSRYENGAIKRM